MPEPHRDYRYPPFSESWLRDPAFCWLVEEELARLERAETAEEE